MLKGKNILVGVTGGIAAYKTATLVRELKKAGAEVKVIMTPLAKQFITPLTLATLSQNPIVVDFFNPENGEWNSHVKLGLWADAYVIAPATANSLAKMANGIADNLLLTTYLSARCPIFVCPTMDLDMYKHSSTQRNLDVLRADNVNIIEPQDGFLASGLTGKGRMEEPEEIANKIKEYFSNASSKELQGKKVLITAGGNIEPIDAVRYISNYSSGKMGYALAQECLNRGADVTLIRASVDSKLLGSVAGIQEIKAMSADDMHKTVMTHNQDSDIIIMAAAVADFTPAEVSPLKLKKQEGQEFMTINLRKTVDIAAELGSQKRDNQCLVGFALETDSERENALKKLNKKNLDFIVLNSLQDKDAGFKLDTNKVTIFHKNGASKTYTTKQKDAVAIDIVDEICSVYLK
ncbi:MAG: bifunctional phosphopantothenoylcysteine decarboxylase/phosphopantothenate--cysteine ligase CoaBC [Rikenellaceae bacterium]